MIGLVSFGNTFVDDGKFQCGFENDGRSGEVDMFNILILFIIFEVEIIFLVMMFYRIVFVVLVILMIIVLELFGEIV